MTVNKTILAVFSAYILGLAIGVNINRFDSCCPKGKDVKCVECR